LPVFVVGVALLYGGLIIKDLEVPEVFPVDNVQVIGELTYLDKQTIATVVSDNIDGGYFTVDLNKIREALKQQPWVKNVSLRRQWPAQLDVFITEQVPVAYWNHDGYINNDGEVFKPEAIDESLELLELNGPDGRQEIVWKFMNSLYQEIALLDFEVVRLDLDDRRSWQLVLTENDNDTDSPQALSKNKMSTIDVKLGRFDTEKRLKRFVRILPLLAVDQKVKGNDLTGEKIKVIDMRYPNGFAVQMTTVSSMAVYMKPAPSKGA
jgi:cell division protein FtsQ